MWSLKFAVAVVIALLPSFLKIPLYRRLFGYRIGRGVRIGFVPFLGVARCTIGDGARIGSFNLFYRLGELAIGRQARIGFLNVFRGGERVSIGDFCTILRQNTINSIIDGDLSGPAEASFAMGAGAVIASGHWFDFTAGISLGENVIVGGRNSSFWTHNRQRGRPVSVGRHTYLGSEIRVAPGVEVAPLCVVALGSVLSGRYDLPRTLIGGNPAIALRPLAERDLYLVTHRTRKDLPDDLATAHLPDDLRGGPAQGRPSPPAGLTSIPRSSPPEGDDA